MRGPAGSGSALGRRLARRVAELESNLRGGTLAVTRRAQVAVTWLSRARRVARQVAQVEAHGKWRVLRRGLARRRGGGRGGGPFRT